MSTLTEELRGHVKRQKVKDKSAKIGFVGHLKLLLMKIPGGHIGGLAAVGAYYFVTQLLHGQHTTVWNAGVTFPDVKYFWDHLLDAPLRDGGLVNAMSHHEWNTWRHLVRPLYEGIFGGLLFMFVSINPLKIAQQLKRDKHGDPAPTRFTRAEIALKFVPTLYTKVTPFQLGMAPVTITLYSIPGVLLGYGVDRLLRLILHVKSLAPALGAHPSVIDKFYSGAFDAKIIGLFGAAFMAKRPAKALFAHTVQYFAQRRALAGKRCHFWHAPGYAKTVQYYIDNPHVAMLRQGGHTNVLRVATTSAALFTLGMAALGYWVLRFVAG